MASPEVEFGYLLVTKILKGTAAPHQQQRLWELRQELGERAFWTGIRYYTHKYFGKSATTADFQTAMEQASGKNLTGFFAKWVYLTG